MPSLYVAHLHPIPSTSRLYNLSTSRLASNFHSQTPIPSPKQNFIFVFIIAPSIMAQEHIVMFPYMAQGHLIPFLALAKLISKRFPNYIITFVNTPLNIQNLHTSLPPNSNIHLQSLPFRSSDFGLPPETENTDSVPASLTIRLFRASESLELHFARLVSDLTQQYGEPPFLIIADVFFGWSVGIARGLNIFHASFATSGAYGTAAYFSLWLHLPHRHTESPEFNIPGFPETFKLDRSQLSSHLRAADGQDPRSKFLQRQISHSLESDAMVCNTVEEVEGEGLRLLRENSGLSVWPVGPLLPPDSDSSRGRVGRKAAGMEAEDIAEWLDVHGPGSVIYVSFGSQNTISRQQMAALANGLESSGHPFVWVIRPPIGSDLGSGFRPEWLPDGFESRMREKKQGLLVRGWAPQLEILSRGSIGAFLTHCGWNSIQESLSRGVAMIGWPLAAEQFYNSKMVEEDLGVGVELARGVVDEVQSERVVEVVKLVMEKGRGKEMRAKAKILKEMMRNATRDEGEEQGSSIRAVDEFIRAAISSRMEKRNASR